MTTEGGNAAIKTSAARSLASDARSRRGRLAIDDPERHFYLGVEAAAHDLRHPEVRDARPESWLDHEAVAFREGYLRTSILLASVATSDRAAHVDLPAYR